MSTSLLTPEQLALARAKGSPTRFYLAIQQMPVIFRARLNDIAAARGLRVLTFDQHESITPEDVIPGVTLYVGTTADGREKGRVRVKSVSWEDAEITVAENSHIAWQDNDYISIRKVFEPWVIYPRVTTNEAGDQLEVWQDYDTVYTDQNEKYPPVAVLGPPAIRYCHDKLAGQSIGFDGSRSYALNGATIVDHFWNFGVYDLSLDNNGSPLHTHDETPGDILFDCQMATTPNDYVSLTVTDSNGKTHTGYRWLRVFTELDPPITKFTVESLEGSYDEGSWRAQITVRDGSKLAPENIMDGTMVCIFADNTQGLPLNPNYTDRDNLLFVGWAVGETVRQDGFTNDVHFEAVGTCGRMAMLESYPDTFEVPLSTAHPTKWWELDEINLDTVLYAHLKWRSNLFDITDVYLPMVAYTDWHPGTPWAVGPEAYRVMRQDFTQGDLYSQVNEFMQSAMGRVLSDKTGCVYCRIDPQVYPTANRADLPYYMHIEDTDWRDEITVERREMASVSQVDLGGVHYAGGTNPESDAHPILALAPGTVPMYEGRVEKVDGLIVPGGQTFANRLAGDILGWKNNPFPASTMTFSGKYAFVDFAPPVWIFWTLEPTSNKRQIGWTQARFIPRTVQIRIVPEGGQITVESSLEKEADGPDGVTGVYPPTEPDPPTIPPPTIPIPTPPTGKRWRKNVLCATSNGPYYTNSFVTSSASIAGVPVWRRLVGGMDPSDVSTHALAFHPQQPHLTHYCITRSCVYRRRPAVSDNWVPVLTTGGLGGTFIPGVRMDGFYSIQTNPTFPSHVYVIYRSGPMAGPTQPENITPQNWFIKSVDQGNTWEPPVAICTRRFMYRYPGAGQENNPINNHGVSDLQVFSVAPGTTLYTAIWDASAGLMLYQSNNLGTSWDEAVGLGRLPADRQSYYLSHDKPGGYFRLFSHKTVSGQNRIYRSVTNGATGTWTMLGGPTWYPQAHSNMTMKHWINVQQTIAGLTRVADGYYMYKSTDYGNTWTRTLMVSTGAHAADFVELVPDSPDYLYLWCNGDHISDHAGGDRISASQNEGATRVAKGGVAPTNVPATAYVRDLTPIWTLE
jgi:hypothetical protein